MAKEWLFLFEKVITWFFWTIFSKVITEKIYLLASSYIEYRATYLEVYSSHLACISDETNHKNFEYLCSMAARESQKWPIIEAIGKLLRETPSCIQFSCEEALVSMGNSWASLIFFGIIGFVVSFYLISRVFKIIEYFAVKRYASSTKEQDSMYYQYYHHQQEQQDYRPQRDSPFVVPMPTYSVSYDTRELEKKVNKQQHSDVTRKRFYKGDGYYDYSTNKSDGSGTNSKRLR
jgi:hypothetical protein